MESIERATVAAVAPQAVVEFPGWLVALDSGTVRRSRSAVALAHDVQADPAIIDAIEAEFRGRRLEPAFRLADAAGLMDLRENLLGRGYRSEQPTLVMTGDVAGLVSLRGSPPAQVDETADDSWKGVFLGPGFDPVDGASRMSVLTRAQGSLFGSVREGGRAIAVGVASFSHGWLSIHGMRTEAVRRGEGLAGRVLAALGRAARERSIERVFLQVEEGNAAARALYGRAGFTRAWRYHYWSLPPSTALSSKNGDLRPAPG